MTSKNENVLTMALCIIGNTETATHPAFDHFMTFNVLKWPLNENV